MRPLSLTLPKVPPRWRIDAPVFIGPAPVLIAITAAPSLAPVASGVDVKHAPVDDSAPVVGALGARAIALGAPDARALLARRLDAIERMAKGEGRTVWCVFDLDNTLWDTRSRTLFILHDLADHSATLAPEERARLHALTIDDVSETGALTVDAMDPSLSSSARGEVDAAWAREFWNPKNAVHDQPIEEMMELARECERRGARIGFSTGRAESFTIKNPDGSEEHTGFRAVSTQMLQAHGFVVDESNLKLKPTPQDITPIKKALDMAGFASGGAVVGLYVTDGKNDMGGTLDVLKEMQKLDALAPAARFRVGCSFEQGKASRGADWQVPVLPGFF